MIRFECDYLEGAPVPVMEALAKANLEQHPGYGFDHHSERAKELIRRACQAPEAAVFFLVGGTQANLTVSAAVLKPYQGVIAPQTAHIFNHETGAIEATGHKILSVQTDDGKLTARQVQKVCEDYWNETHALFFVQPGMVYISQTTEVGTMYSRSEIKAIHDVCRQYGMKLFVDGARLGYALAAPDSDMTFAALPQICDVFTIGGTKQGALFGEAVVMMDDELAREFLYHVKQRGGLLAKGWILGVQYEALFTDNVYMKGAKHAADLAVTVRNGLIKAGYTFLYDHQTNQQLPILTPSQVEQLSRSYSFDHFADLPDGRIAVRICTSWATKEEDVEALLADMAAINQK